MIFIDTETCGFHGPICLIQYAKDNGEIKLFSPWNEPIFQTLKLIENFCENTIIGFNLTFDWFHLQKLYNMFSEHSNYDDIPYHVLDDLANHGAAARDGLCIKPKDAFDLMLHARKGPYQSTMDRNDIRIKRVPTALAWKLADKLCETIKFNNIYFAKRADPTERWKVFDIKNDLGDIEPNFKDIVLKFQPSSALKALAMDALNLDVLKFKDIDCDIKVKENGWAPFASSIGSPGDWKGSWPAVIELFIAHWSYNELARDYARDDIIYTRSLFKYFSALDEELPKEEARKFANSDKWFDDTIRPIETGDDDSILACMVGSVRWKGYKIDVPALKKLKEKYSEDVSERSLATAPRVAKKYLLQFMDDTEKIIIQTSTKRQILEEIIKWEKDEGGEHLAAKAAKKILDARKAVNRIKTIDKLIQAGRFHTSFKIIGTLSSRMSGTDGLNPQGIAHDKAMRSCFPLALDGFVLSGGDFAGFEITLADAEYNDPNLHADLLSGKKIHALLGQFFYPDMEYDDIIASKGEEDDKYDKSKRGVFALIYGGNENTLSDRVGITLENAETAYQEILKKYPQIGVARQKVFDSFCSMRQPAGIGTKVEWHEPAQFVESMFGFRRYFTLENKICKTLFELANDPPKDWLDCKIKVVRRDRQQTATGAVRSALFAAAFAVQASNMRAAANHRIQSSGAQITKKLERELWSLQPHGVRKWHIMPMNIHDEIMTPCLPELIDSIDQIVKKTVESFRPTVPLIEIDWNNNFKSWADK